MIVDTAVNRKIFFSILLKKIITMLCDFIMTVKPFQSPLPSVIPVVTRCSSFSLLIIWPKKVLWYLHILFKSDLVISASLNTISFDFFSVYEIRSISSRNYISPASSFFCSCFEIIVQTSIPYIKMSSMQHSRALLVWMEMYVFECIDLFSGNHFCFRYS